MGGLGAGAASWPHLLADWMVSLNLRTGRLDDSSCGRFLLARFKSSALRLKPSPPVGFIFAVPLALRPGSGA